MLRRSVLAALLATSSAWNAPARAEPTPTELKQAREAFALAARDERAGEWAAALDRLRRIAELKTTPGIRFHIALCEENLGRLAAALEAYGEAEAQAMAENNEEVLAAVKEPLSALRARLPRLVVRPPQDVRGLVVVLDGKQLPASSLGLELHVDPRGHALEARAPGRPAFLKGFTPAERELVTIEIAFDDEPPSKETPAKSAAASVKPAPTPLEAARTAPAEHGGAGAIVASAGAIVLAGGGLGAFLLASGAQADGRAQCVRQIDCSDLRRPVRTWDAVALSAWIGAGALGAVAVVLWTSPRGGDARGGRLVAGPSGATLAGSF